jgi:acetoin utilization deacetylase AcuC-like enzyme
VLGFVVDELFLQHRAPAGHPERAARTQVVAAALADAGFLQLGRLVAPCLAGDDLLLRVHTPEYIAMLHRTLPGASGWLDPDTYYGPSSWEVALAAAGSVSDLTLRVLAGELAGGIAVVRPPGHHASAGQAMGFCILNNVAVAAAAARAAGAARVAIVDWDVHHGNGTQDIFWDDPTVMYLSVHQFPHFPGSGAAVEVGGARARGATVNVALPAGCGDSDYLAVFDQVVLPALRRFRPDLILVSAGFDACEGDPLAAMKVTKVGFAAMASRVVAVADEVCAGRVVVALEGGYHLEGLAGGMTGVLAAMARRAPGDATEVAEASLAAMLCMDETRRAHGEL